MTRSLLVLGLLSLISVLAYDTATAANSQQQKMAACSSDAKAKALKGDERKSFMKSCLSADSAAAGSATGNSQQEKMKTCNADAKTKGLKDADRKTFMSNCLKGAAQ